jgi:hypothetical protein
MPFIDVSVTPKVRCIDERELTEVGQDGTQQQSPPCPETSTEPIGHLIMNSKLLFAATVAVSLLSTVAVADAAPLTRAQVTADLNQAIASHTLQRTDYDTDRHDVVATSDRTRADVVADLAAAKAARKVLVGPYANRTFNSDGTAIFAQSTLTRAEVKAEVLQAAAAGTLQRTDYDDASVVARRVQQHAAAPTLAQRAKATATGI